MKIKKIDHIVIYASDVKASIQFYKMLGFVLQDEKNRYILSVGDFALHLYEKGNFSFPYPEKASVGGLEFCLELDNGLAMLKTYLQEQGIVVLEGIVPRSGAKGSMQSIYLEDPDGNHVEICSYQ